MLSRLLAAFFRLPYIRGKTRADELLCRLFATTAPLKVRGGLLMELDPVEWTQMQLIKGDWLEPLTIALYEKLLRPGGVFIDVGAHVGFHSLVARAAVGPEGLVAAVEPQPYNAAKILANWRVNGFTNLKLFVAAAGEKPGAVWLHEQAASDRSVLSLDLSVGKNLPQAYEVNLVTLDSVVDACGGRMVDVLKIDVEGFELDVLRGLGEKLANVRQIIFEFLNPAGQEAKSHSLVEFLLSSGFELRNVKGEAWKEGDDVPERNLWAARP